LELASARRAERGKPARLWCAMWTRERAVVDPEGLRSVLGRRERKATVNCGVRCDSSIYRFMASTDMGATVSVVATAEYVSSVACAVGIDRSLIS